MLLACILLFSWFSFYFILLLFFHPIYFEKEGNDIVLKRKVFNSSDNTNSRCIWHMSTLIVSHILNFFKNFSPSFDHMLGDEKFLCKT